MQPGAVSTPIEIANFQSCHLFPGGIMVHAASISGETSGVSIEISGVWWDAHATSKTSTSTPNRHLTPEQIMHFGAALSRFSASKIGISTLGSSPERVAFRRFGWTPIRAKDIDPSEAWLMGLTFGPLRHSGVSVITGKLNPEPVIAALEAAKVPHRVIAIADMGGYVYRSGVDASMLVVFIGPKDEPQPDQ
jgi:hypothetical protein